MSDPDKGSVLQINSLAAGQGLSWLKDGIWYFQRNPFAWSLSLLLWAVMFSVLMVIPLLGQISMFLLSPVFLAGFMRGADRQQQGGDFTIGDIFSGFSRSLDQLILVGFFSLLGMIVVTVIVMLPMGNAMLGMGMMPADELAMGGAGMNLDALDMDIGVMLLGALLGLFLMIPVLMAYWFAPTLVLLKQLKAVDAIVLSFKACVKNIIPFLVYGVVACIVLLITVLLMGVVVVIAMQADMWLVWPVVVLLGFVVSFAVFSVFIASVYVACKSIIE